MKNKSLGRFTDIRGRAVHGVTAALAAALALQAAPAFAAGTLAGTTITNTSTVVYEVEGISQPSLSTDVSVTVDRKINLTVTEEGTASTIVVPGRTAAVTTFRLSNLSNDTIDFRLTAANQTQDTTVRNLADNFDVTNFKIYQDTDASGSFDAANDTVITYLDEVAADASRLLFVVADIPNTTVNGDAAGITLTGQASEGKAAGSLGVVIEQTTGADTTGIDTVFADAGTNTGTFGDTGTPYDGMYTGWDDYLVQTSSLAITKTAIVISDPVNNTTNPKAIPGAKIEYCIRVSNLGGTRNAANLVISDTVPGEVEFDTNFGVKAGGGVVSGQCDDTGAIVGTHNASVISATIPLLAIDETKTVRFQGTIK